MFSGLVRVRLGCVVVNSMMRLFVVLSDLCVIIVG